MVAKIAVITYSMYGHVNRLAEEIVKGVKSSGANVTRLQFHETLPDEVLTKMHAPAKDASIPVLEKPDQLKEFDGILLGFPTRFGRAPAQVSTFFDQTGGLWATGGLLGKFAGLFTSSASQHGGQEATILTTIPWLAHQGLIYVPIGYETSHLSDNSEIIGGSQYGAATIAGGDGSRQPTVKELEVALNQGKSFGRVVGQYVAGASKVATGGGTEAARAVPSAATGAPASTSDKPAAKGGYDAEPAPTSGARAPPTSGQAGASGDAKQPGLWKKLTMSCGGNQDNYQS